MSPAAEFAFFAALAAVCAKLVLQLYLLGRQAKSVARSRGAVPAGFEESVTPEEHRKSCDYTLAKLRVEALDNGAEAAVTVILLSWGLAALGDLIVPEAGALRGTAFVGCVLLLSSAAGLPFALHRQLKLERRFGFGRMTPGLFLADLAKGLAVTACIGLPLLGAILWCVGAAGAYWWLWAWALLSGANLLVAVIFPTWIAPLFNKFEPLGEGGLRSRAEAMLERCGFASDGLFVADGSRRSRHSNAYFAGLGRSKRVVLFDTLVDSLDEDEIAAVLAHELGHCKLRHIRKRLLWSLGASLAMFAALGGLFATGWFFEAFGLEPSAGAGIAIALLAAPAFGLPLAPAFSALSRKHEFEADAFAADLESAPALESALLKLYRDNAAPLAPDELYSKFHYSHPPASQRLARLRSLAAA